MPRVDVSDRRVTSVKEIDFSGLRVPVITIYESPRDYPGCMVARVFDVNEPTNVIIVRETLEELKQDIEQNTDLVFIPRCAEDDDVIAGIYI